MGTQQQSSKEEEEDAVLAIRQRDEFLAFARIFLAYLGRKDHQLGTRIRARAVCVIRQCAMRHKRGEPGYENVIEAMRQSLKDVVSDQDWWKANNQFVRLVMSRRRRGRKRNTTTAAPPLS